MIKQHVATRAIQTAVKGREPEILRALGVDWQSGNPHIRCPYPSHADENPSWRWDEQKACSFCTCIEKSDSIFDVTMRVKEIEFDAAKVVVAELLGREDLICEGNRKQTGYQATDAQSLLNAPAEHRDDNLPIRYLAHRLGIAVEEVPHPSTPWAGLKQLGYFDPPSTARAKPKLVGHFPGAVFGTTAVDGRRHAHRIYLALGGAGKADLGTMPDGNPRQAKKSARIPDGGNRSGCAVLWGDPERAPSLYLAEGIETAAAIAFVLHDKIAAGAVAVAAAISATGLETFQPYPATGQVIVCADRDEAAKVNGQPGSRRGEQAARKFAIQHYQELSVYIVLPGKGGETVDWLDILRREGADYVHVSLLCATEFEPTQADLSDLARRQSGQAELNEIADLYPLPEMDTIKLKYAHTPGGKVKVHKILGIRTDPVSGQAHEELAPIATPFGVPARLRHADQHDAYGLRCVVQGMNGQPRAVDFDRGEFAKMNASDIRAKLFAAGLRIEADGETIALQCLKAADPQSEIIVYHRPGWHDLAGTSAPVFICPSGEVIGAPEDVGAELAATTRLDADVAVSGTFQAWKDAVAAALSEPGCPH